MNRNKFLPILTALILMLILSAAVLTLQDPSYTYHSVFAGLPEGDAAYTYILNRAPLSYLNIVGPLLFLTGDHGQKAETLIALALFVYCIFLGLSRDESPGRTLARGALMALFLFHPYSLWLLTQSPTDVFMLPGLFAFNRGLLEINGRSQGRGIILMALGSTLLFLCGTTGIAFTIALIVSAPVILRSELFRKSLMGGTIILAFPVFAASLGIAYLSWLFQISPEVLAFDHPSKTGRSFEALALLPFVFLILPSVRYIKERGLAGFLERHSSFILIPLGALCVILLGRTPPAETILGFLVLSSGLEFMNRGQHFARHALLAGCFLALSWGLFLWRPDTIPFIYSPMDLPVEDLARSGILLAVLLLGRVSFLQTSSQRKFETHKVAP